MKLKRFELIAGGQFNGQSPSIVIDFTKSKVVGGKSDEEGGKTTLIEMILLNTGMIGGEKVIKDLINTETGELKSKIEYEVGKDTYEVTQSKGVLTVRKDGAVQPGGAQTLLRQTLGMVGISPMSIKDAPIEKIVKWLAGYSTSGAEEFEKKMLKLKNDIKTAKAARAAANKSAKGAKEYLVGEGYVDEKGDLIEKSWLQSEKDFAEEPDIKELSRKLTAAGAKSDKFIENESKTNNQKERKAQIEKQIKDLQKELTQVDENIGLGEKWLAANATAKKDYDAIKKQYDNAAQDVSDYNKWQMCLTKKKEWDDFDDLSIKADGLEKAALKKQQDLQWEVIPDIKGVELLLEDDDDREAGYYFEGKNSRQLSASQWFGQVVKILKKNGVGFLVIDDISQFGSSFIETLKQLSKTCTILYTEMLRGQEEIIFDYNLK